MLPTLQVQRDLLDVPSGVERFKEYLNVMTRGTDDIVLPLPAFNPMSKDHVTRALDALLAIDAERIAADAIAEAEARLRLADIDLRLTVVVTDDVAGGWTNREMMEVDRLRAVPKPMHKRGFHVVFYWASEPVTERKVRSEVLAEIYRLHYLLHNESPNTLGAMMRLEGDALAFAGAESPTLEPDDLDYVREVIEPYRAARALEDFPTVFTCLFGDAAAKKMGYSPMGLSDRAGIALALAIRR